MKKIIVLALSIIMLLSVGCSAAVSVVGANINEDGHLVLSMSDGSTIDAGYAKGEKGNKGDIGPQGPQGIQGPQGEVGPQGPKGERGPQGEKGDTGAAGRDGVDGKDGTDGKDSASGAAGQTPYIGENGNWWIGNEDTGIIAKTTDFIFNDNGNGTVLLAYVGSDTNVIIPDKTTEIYYEAFIDNKLIQTVEIPSNVKAIGVRAFYNCVSLNEIILPDGLLTLGESAFQNCVSLESVYIPHSVLTNPGDSNLGAYIFENCSSLTQVTFGTAGATSSSTGRLSPYMFGACTALNNITIPEYISRIWNGAFWRCSPSITLLSSNVVTASLPSDHWGGIFADNNPNAIYVPKALIEAYKTDTFWSTYAGIIQAIS